jgi:uncharacterized protein (DUF1330 family)
MRSLIALALLVATPALATPPPAPGTCDGKPVIMLIAGDIRDRARLQAYGAAIRDSGLYDKLGAYYINVPRVLDVFEGTPPPSQSMLMVRFPCLAHARAFWYSRTYQEKLKPLRLDPSAGDFTVTVYPEAPPTPAAAPLWPPHGLTSVPGPDVVESIPQVKELP